MKFGKLSFTKTKPSISVLEKMSTKLSQLKVKSKALSVLLKFPDGTCAWTRVESPEALEILKKTGVQVVETEKLADDIDNSKLKKDGENQK
jgi:hypothetical protein